MTYPIPDSVLVHHAASLGKTRSGKSSTAKTADERFVAAGDRVCILDPIKSDWWWLTSSANGKPPGLPFQILGRPHRHVLLPEAAGKVIGELVATGALALSIIDMADFRAGGLQQFFYAFAEALMRHQTGILHLVIEEAQEFAPKELAGCPFLAPYRSLMSGVEELSKVVIRGNSTRSRDREPWSGQARPDEGLPSATASCHSRGIA